MLQTVVPQIVCCFASSQHRIGAVHTPAWETYSTWSEKLWKNEFSHCNNSNKIFKAVQVGFLKRDLKVVPTESYCRAENRNCVLSSCTKLLNHLWRNRGRIYGKTAAGRDGGLGEKGGFEKASSRFPGTRYFPCRQWICGFRYPRFRNLRFRRNPGPPSTLTGHQARAASTGTAQLQCACPRGQAEGRSEAEGLGFPTSLRACAGESMATLRRLREVPRHLLVCEKSNFGHDKSRHRHLVETHYHNYRVSLAVVGHSGSTQSPGAGEMWGKSRSVRSPPSAQEGRGPALGTLGAVVSILLRAGSLQSCRTTTPRMRRE